MNNENQHTEFKRIWKDDYLKWVCGYANGQGGRMYIEQGGVTVIIPREKFVAVNMGGTTDINRYKGSEKTDINRYKGSEKTDTNRTKPNQTEPKPNQNRTKTEPKPNRRISLLS